MARYTASTDWKLPKLPERQQQSAPHKKSCPVLCADMPGITLCRTFGNKRLPRYLDVWRSSFLSLPFNWPARFGAILHLFSCLRLLFVLLCQFTPSSLYFVDQAEIVVILHRPLPGTVKLVVGRGPDLGGREIGWL